MYVPHTIQSFILIHVFDCWITHKPQMYPPPHHLKFTAMLNLLPSVTQFNSLHSHLDPLSFSTSLLFKKWCWNCKNVNNSKMATSNHFGSWPFSCQPLINIWYVGTYQISKHSTNVGLHHLLGLIIIGLMARRDEAQMMGRVLTQAIGHEDEYHIDAFSHSNRHLLEKREENLLFRLKMWKKNEKHPGQTQLSAR